MTIIPNEPDAHGLTRATLHRAVKDGRFERIARGLYRAADAPAADWDLLEATSRRSDATICLTSALAHYDLTDAIPDALAIAIPRGDRIPVTQSAIRWHQFARTTFAVGRTVVAIPGAPQTIGLYSPERCIADAFRLRGELGYEFGRDALREWLRRGGKPADLMSIATQLPRAKKPLLDALQAMA